MYQMLIFLFLLSFAYAQNTPKVVADGTAVKRPVIVAQEDDYAVFKREYEARRSRCDTKGITEEQRLRCERLELSFYLNTKKVEDRPVTKIMWTLYWDHKCRNIRKGASAPEFKEAEYACKVLADDMKFNAEEEDKEECQLPTSVTNSDRKLEKALKSGKSTQQPDKRSGQQQ